MGDILSDKKKKKKNLSQEEMFSVVVIYLRFLFSKSRHILANVIKMEGTPVKLHHDYILSDASHVLSSDKIHFWPLAYHFNTTLAKTKKRGEMGKKMPLLTCARPLCELEKSFFFLDNFFINEYIVAGRH